MRPKGSDRAPGAFPRAVVFGPLLIGLLALSGQLEWLERRALDELFELRGIRQPDAQIVIIAVNGDTFDQLGVSWPLPRSMHAQLIETLSTGGPLVIGVDLLFSGPSVRGPDDDTALSRALRRAGNVVLAAGIAVDSSPSRRGARLVRPLLEIGSGAAAVGPAAVILDGDGVVRSGYVRYEFEGTAGPSFAAHVARLATTARGVAARPREASAVLIDYRGGPGTYTWIPYHRVIRDEIPDEMIRGKIVLVGSVDPLEHDLYSTPFARRRGMPGVELQANLIETLLSGKPVHEVPPVVSALVAILVAALAAGVVVLPGRQALVAAGLGSLATCTATFAAFAVGGIWFRSVGATLGIVLGFSWAMILKASGKVIR